MSNKVAFLTRDRGVGEYFSKNFADIFKRFNPTDDFLGLSYITNKFNNEEFGSFLLRKGRNADSLSILIDEDFIELAEDAYTPYLFIHRFRAKSNKTIGNYLSLNLSDFYKKFKHRMKFMSNLGSRKHFILPHENFHSKVMQDYRYLICNSETKDDSIYRDIEDFDRKMRNLKVPKNRDPSRNQFYKDERGFYFEYGTERHGRPDTEQPPHFTKCEIGSNFKIGIRYESERHFNVSHDGRPIKGEYFVDCHGDNFTATALTHVNIFPNNFCK